MQRNAQLKILTISFLAVIRLVFLVGFPVALFWLQIDDKIDILNNLYIAASSVLLWVIVYVCGLKFNKRLAALRNERDFDDNGLNRKYNEYQKLSPKERAEIDKQRLADIEQLIGTGTVKKITKNGSTDPEFDLEKLLGLQDVKTQIKEMSARMEFDKKHKKEMGTSQISSNHMCFVGPPGTGKTTCAKIMTGFLHKYGYIKTNKYLEIDGNFLRGQSKGETSKKTSMLLSMSKGKVLFIDEAYAMFSGPDAQEAIATLIKFMEDERDNFVLIIAGYEREMRQLIDSNPGFFSRIGHILHFADYTDDELYDIFSHMANDKNFYVPYETKERFKKRMDREKKEKYFGNARTCRNVLDESISRHALNLKKGILTKEQTFMIMPEDIVVSVQKKL